MLSIDTLEEIDKTINFSFLTSLHSDNESNNLLNF